MNALAVGVGGFLGSVSRYAIGAWIHRSWPALSFPAGTLTVNVIGCLLIGVLGSAVEIRNIFSAQARALVFVGVLGGFTTFSAFADETVSMMKDGATARAGLNIGANIVLCLIAVWIGSLIGRALWRAG